MLNATDEEDNGPIMRKIEDVISEARRLAISPTHETMLMTEAVHELLKSESQKLRDKIDELTQREQELISKLSASRNS